MCVALICALMAQSAGFASPKPLDEQTVRNRIVKRGVGNAVWVQESNGIALWGRVARIDEQTFGLQLHNYPEVTPIRYSDVVKLRMGMSQGSFWAITIVGFAAVIALALTAHHEMGHRNMQMPTLPNRPALR
jgi:hypothetical protein